MKNNIFVKALNVDDDDDDDDDDECGMVDR